MSYFTCHNCISFQLLWICYLIMWEHTWFSGTNICKKKSLCRARKPFLLQTEQFPTLTNNSRLVQTVPALCVHYAWSIWASGPKLTPWHQHQPKHFLLQPSTGHAAEGHLRTDGPRRGLHGLEQSTDIVVSVRISPQEVEIHSTLDFLSFLQKEEEEEEEEKEQKEKQINKRGKGDETVGGGVWEADNKPCLWIPELTMTTRSTVKFSATIWDSNWFLDGRHIVMDLIPLCVGKVVPRAVCLWNHLGRLNHILMPRSCICSRLGIKRCQHSPADSCMELHCPSKDRRQRDSRHMFKPMSQPL